MAVTSVLFDTAAPPGSKFDPEVQAEVEALAPGLDTHEVVEINLDDDSVSTRTIQPGAVTTVEIAEGGVAAINLAEAAVNEAAIAPDAVTAEKAGLGVSTAYDADGNPVEDKKVYLTAAQYAALTTKDPNTTYYIN